MYIRSLKTNSRNKALLYISQQAHARLATLYKFAIKNDPDKNGIVFGTRKRGCNGNSYTMRYLTKYESKNNIERLVNPQHPPVYIEHKSILSLIGTTIDYEENAIFAGFTFTNPNSKGMCGCGESFNT